VSENRNFLSLELDQFFHAGQSYVCFHVRTPCLLVFAFITLMAGKAKLYMANHGYAFALGLVSLLASFSTRVRHDGSYLTQLKKRLVNQPNEGGA